MTCYQPIKAWKTSEVSKTTGKKQITFKQNKGDPHEAITVPCGTCIGCKIDRAKQWSIRCLHEAKMHLNNCFITLTYDDKHIIEHCGIWDEQKGGCTGLSLNKQDFVLFMKKLRNHYGHTRIRFFHCGEYGDNFSRPHHHACLFGHDFKDKVLWDTRSGTPLYRSPKLESLWPYGFSTIGEVTLESAQYCARYVTKKLAKGEDYGDKEPEYITMSRRPGIGRTYYEKYRQDILNVDGIITTKGLRLKTPKYYDKIYDNTNPAEMEALKLERKSKIKPEECTPARLRDKEQIALKKIFEKKRTYEKGETQW